MKIEARGIRCLDCSGLDLQSHPDRARGGFGQCQRWNPAQFVIANMSRNCMEFDQAPADVVEARDTWAAGLKNFWQK